MQNSKCKNNWTQAIHPADEHGILDCRIARIPALWIRCALSFGLFILASWSFLHFAFCILHFEF